MLVVALHQCCHEVDTFEISMCAATFHIIFLQLSSMAFMRLRAKTQASGRCTFSISRLYSAAATEIVLA